MLMLVQSRAADLALQDEIDQWERLSDEALVDFENDFDKRDLIVALLRITANTLD